MSDSTVGSIRSSGAAVKQLRNVKRPRPLKLLPSQVEEMLEQMQQVELDLKEQQYHVEATKRIDRLSKLLKEHGSALECLNKVF